MGTEIPANRAPAGRRGILRVVIDRESLAGSRRQLWQDTDHRPAVSRLALSFSAALHLCIITACAFWPQDTTLMIENVYAVTMPTASELIPPMQLAWVSATPETTAESCSTNNPLSVDQAGALSLFWQAVRSAVARNISYPPAAKRQGIEGMAVLRLTVAEDGRLLEAVPMESSADVFADAALRAVHRAAPFPTLTNDTTALSAVLPVRFRLDGLEANHRTP